jgi:hypothetical protein
MLNDSGMVAFKDRRRGEHNEVMIYYLERNHKIYVQLVDLESALFESNIFSSLSQSTIEYAATPCAARHR